MIVLVLMAAQLAGCGARTLRVPDEDAGRDGGADEDAAVAPALEDVVAVSAGVDHTCAVVAGGDVYCWGANAWGQLGDGTTLARALPTQADIDEVRAVVTGLRHTCFLRADASVWCSGYGVYAGFADARTRLAPVRLDALPPASSLTGKGGQTCMTTASGEAWCWGRVLPDPGDTAPVRLEIGSVSDVRGNGAYTCAIVERGLACFGSNGNGNLGDGTYEPRPQTDPVFPPVTDVAQLAIGDANATYAIDSAGSAFGFGAVPLELPSDGSRWLLPNRLPGLPSVIAIAPGGGHGCAIDRAGDLWCWGQNGYGELGRGVLSPVSQPAERVPGLSAVTSADLGLAHSCAVVDGRAWCWGWNADGQLGDGTNVDRSVPTLVLR